MYPLLTAGPVNVVPTMNPDHDLTELVASLECLEQVHWNVRRSLSLCAERGAHDATYRVYDNLRTGDPLSLKDDSIKTCKQDVYLVAEDTSAI
jgi:hypothetical protein